MDPISVLLLITLGAISVCIGLVVFLVRAKKSKRKLLETIHYYQEKYKYVENLDWEMEKRTEEFLDTESVLQQQIQTTKSSFAKLKSNYQQASMVYEELRRENELLKDTLEIAEYGVYEPHYELDTSEDYRQKLRENKEAQKELIRNEEAVMCFTSWKLGDSRKQGEVMIKRAIKLTLRAFNGECDTLIGKVKWNNIEQSEKRIRKTFEAINKLNKSNDVHIQEEFLDLKIDELRLTHEYALKKYEEKEEQRRVREQMREEEKARRDFEKAQREAEKEEKLLQQAMEQAKAEMLQASQEEKAQLEKQLAEMQVKLREAEEKNSRALSMAQQTKSGHVYVISNIGSFGENVYKIGMTRRLEPLDRVNELGDASVPFKFDVHAMIYSDNAPELENKLHKSFHHKRLNHINLRREYFDISLEEIEEVVSETNGSIEFVKVPEAKEYRESLIIRNKQAQKNHEDELIEETSAYPSAGQLFADV